MNKIFEEGIQYSDQFGWSIFPVSIDKKPLVSWKAYQQVKPTKEQLLAWSSQYPTANIGAVTGKISGIIVVDIDPRHGGSNELFKEIDTLCVKTGGGGWHYYFQYEEGLTNQAGIKPGIDIRAEGGYIVIPPSLHASGNRYEHIESPHGNNSILPLPTFVKEWIKEAKGTSPNKFNEDFLKGVGEGQRNQSATSLIGKLVARLPEEEWETTVWELVRSWNEQNKPPLPQNELFEAFSSITNKEKLRQDSLHSNKEEAAMQWEEPVDLTSLSYDKDSIDWMWEGYLTKGHVTLLTALWKVGKSTFLSWLLKHLQTGETLLGMQIKASKVLIISEESKNKWAKRKDYHGYLEDKCYVISRPTNRKLTENEWLAFIQKVELVCKEKQIELVIIDTIGNFWSVKDENAAPQVTGALLPLNTLVKNDIAVLIVHHDRKSKGEEGMASRGSGALPGFVDIQMSMERFDPARLDDRRRVIKSFSRFDETPLEVVIELTDYGYITHGTKNQAQMKEKLDDLLELLPDEPNGITKKEIVEGWSMESDKIPDSSTISRWLNKLEKQGKIKVVGVDANKKGKPEIWGKCVALQGDSYKGATDEKKEDQA